MPFPPPWRAESVPGRFIFRDANGHALVTNSRDNPTEALQAKMLTKDEARRTAINITRLPELLGRRSAIEPLNLSNGRCWFEFHAYPVELAPSRCARPTIAIHL
jgi:hypothetical protein